MRKRRVTYHKAKRLHQQGDVLYCFLPVTIENKVQAREYLAAASMSRHARTVMAGATYTYSLDKDRKLYTFDEKLHDSPVADVQRCDANLLEYSLTDALIFWARAEAEQMGAGFFARHYNAKLTRRGIQDLSIRLAAGVALHDAILAAKR